MRHDSMRHPRLLIAEPADFSLSALAYLQTVFTVEMQPIDPHDAAAWQRAFLDYDAIWFRLSRHIDAQIIGDNPRCQILATPVTGLDHVDLATCAAKNIKVVALRGEVDFLKTIRATAEHTLALLFALLRHIVPAAVHVADGRWQRDLFRGVELAGLTVGLVGVGRLGALVAPMLKALHMTVLAYDPRVDFPEELIHDGTLQRVGSLEELCIQSDVISIHVNYSEQTHHLLNHDVFHAMRSAMHSAVNSAVRAAQEQTKQKNGKWLINTSRGGVVDEAAMLAALSDGTLAGVALDVLQGEPHITDAHPVVAFAKAHPEIPMVITPHIGGNTYQSFAKTEQFLAERVVQAWQARQQEQHPRTLLIVPARGGSKRVVGKNLRILGDKPLVAHVLDAALAAQKLAPHLISTICLSTDDDQIIQVAQDRYPTGIHIVKRPASISHDTSPAIDYVTHALDFFEGTQKISQKYDVIVIVQPSSPLTYPEDIVETIQLLHESQAESSVSVVKLDHAIHPFKMKVMQQDRLLPFLTEERGRMAAHELPEIFVRNCAVYVTRRSVVDRGQILGDDCRGYVMPRERSVDINDPIDMTLAELLFVEMQKHKQAQEQAQKQRVQG